jgi:hypothetical protein
LRRHHKPASKLEAAYHRADKAIQQIVTFGRIGPAENCREALRPAGRSPPSSKA